MCGTTPTPWDFYFLYHTCPTLMFERRWSKSFPTHAWNLGYMQSGSCKSIPPPVINLEDSKWVLNFLNTCFPVFVLNLEKIRCSKQKSGTRTYFSPPAFFQSNLRVGLFEACIYDILARNQKVFCVKQVYFWCILYLYPEGFQGKLIFPLILIHTPSQ